jgi:hypothetical protein
VTFSQWNGPTHGRDSATRWLWAPQPKIQTPTRDRVDAQSGAPPHQPVLHLIERIVVPTPDVAAHELGDPAARLKA